MLPTLAESRQYDRLTGFFTIQSLVAVAEGVEGLWRKGGKMRLVIGIHDVPRELVRAAERPGWSAEVVAAVRKRLVERAATLREELLRDRIATLAWMLLDGLLEVRVAAPASPGKETGIFHSKRLIFRAGGDVVAASGSANETVAGLSANYEEFMVSCSWRDPDRVKALTDSFELIWTGQRPDLAIHALDDGFARDMLRALDHPTSPPSRQRKTRSQTVDALLRVLRESPAYGPHNLADAVLYPHQERAFLDATSRWPVRVLLADEVGLGKTLEAGAAIAHLLKRGGAERVTILAPKNVLKQWQEELTQHFGLDFWIYDSNAKSFIAPDGTTEPLTRGGSPASAEAPALTLVSAQLARGTRTRPHIFEDGRLPDVLVVDEAHAARLRRDLDGSRRPTLLWRMLDQVADRIPHLVLMTATPVQLEPAEYHSLLQLLGLPDGWDGLPEYERSLPLLAQGGQRIEVNDAKWALRWLGVAYRDYNWHPGGAFPETMLDALQSESFDLQAAIRAVGQWGALYPHYVDAHPAALLTVRNTRGVLERYGYRFPERVLDAPDIHASQDVIDFYRGVDRYLADGFGQVEQVIRRGIALGFVKISYHQRLASSLHAARLTLTRRQHNLKSIVEGHIVDSLEEADDEDGEVETGTIKTDFSREALHRAYDIESAFLEGLIRQLDDLHSSHDEPDPKVRTLHEVLAEHIGRDQVLVFSRYTDTIERCIETFEETFPAEERPGHAKYTGQEAWICTGGELVPATKEGVRRALECGDIGIVFCSDAASEGLNLQAARVLINIDVPWNPGRLEQRIGRVARLGQKAEEVLIVNLWYPDSVEQRMYTRLLSRHEDYQLAVGECPDILASSIRNEVMARIGEGSGIHDNPFDQLQEIRNGIQDRALRAIWDRDLESVPGSQAIRNRLVELLPDGARVGGVQPTGEPGQSGSLSFRHPALESLATMQTDRDAAAGLVLIEAGGCAVGIAKDQGGTLETYAPDQIAELLAYALGQQDCPPPNGGPAADAKAAVHQIISSSRWAPKPSRLRTQSQVAVPLPNPTAGAQATPLAGAHAKV